MPVFKINHVTKYEYDRPVRESMNEIKIYPYYCATQETLSHEIFITGQPDILNFFDYWNNKTGVFNLLSLHKELVIESNLLVRTTTSAQISINFDTGTDELHHEVMEDLRLLELTKPNIIKNYKEVDNILQNITRNTNSVAAIAQNCAAYIYNNFKYIKGITNIETTVDEILEQRAGVCQDFAHVMLQVLRTLQFPSRYVSGYICPNKQGMRGVGATHAWVEVYVPRYGWAGIDPTNNVWVTNNHVKLAVGRHFHDCSPIKGTFKGPAKQKLSVFVSTSYEDGNMFGETNNVKMREYNNNSKEKLVDESLGAQQ